MPQALKHGDCDTWLFEQRGQITSDVTLPGHYYQYPEHTKNE